MLERYALTIVDGLSGVTPRYNVAHGQRALVETRTGISELRWGVLAPWQGHGGKRRPPARVQRSDAAYPWLAPVHRRARR